MFREIRLIFNFQRKSIKIAISNIYFVPSLPFLLYLEIPISMLPDCLRNPAVHTCSPPGHVIS